MFMRNYCYHQCFPILINYCVMYFNHKGNIKIIMWLVLFINTLETKIL